VDRKQGFLPGLADRSTALGRRAAFLPDVEVAEVALFLHSGQVAALEWSAHRRGLTVGQLIRSLIRDYLVSEDNDEPC
jgi:hypothetical protein